MNKMVCCLQFLTLGSKYGYWHKMVYIIQFLTQNLQTRKLQGFNIKKASKRVHNSSPCNKMLLTTRFLTFQSTSQANYGKTILHPRSNKRQFLFVFDVKNSFILIFLPRSLSTVSHSHDNETEMYVYMSKCETINTVKIYITTIKMKMM